MSSVSRKETWVHSTPQKLKMQKNIGLSLPRLAYVKKMQRGDFKTFTPYADENGIIRVGGRVDPSLLSYDDTPPVLLPYKHWICMLFTCQAYQYGHSDVAATTAK